MYEPLDPLTITIHIDKVIINMPVQQAPPADGSSDGVLELRLDEIMTELDTLKQDVANETTVDEAAIKLIQGLKAQLDAAGTDPAALAALSASLESEQAALSAAITANTPAAPATAATVSSTGPAPQPADTSNASVDPLVAGTGA